MEKQAGERQRRGRACWSVSAKISECINMPRRQAEYNPSYIQISSRDHRQPRYGEAKGKGRRLVTVTSVSGVEQGGTPQRFLLNYIKNVLSYGLIFLATWDSDIFHGRIKVLLIFFIFTIQSEIRNVYIRCRKTWYEFRAIKSIQLTKSVISIKIANTAH